jgi:hypothetical protein
VRTTTIAIGLGFGAILAGVLLAPLYVALPARYVDNWFYVSSGWALGGLAAALLLAAAAGFCAALADEEGAILNGTYAGLISSLVAGALVVLPSSGIEACGSLLAMAAYDTITAERLARTTADAAVAGAWIPPAIGLGVAGSGAALGAVGGVVYDLWRGSSSRLSRRVHRSAVPFVGMLAVALGALLAAIWAAHLDLTVLPRIGHPLDMSGRMQLALPQLTAGAAASWFVAWGMRDVVLTWRDERRFAALVWMGTLLSLPALAAIGVGVIHLPSYGTPAPWLALGGVGVAAMVSLVASARSELVREPRPRLMGEVLGETLFATVVFVCVPLFISGSSVLTSYLIVFPYARAIVGGAALVDAPPGVMVNQVFGWHWGMLPLSFLLFLLLAVTVGPLWGVVRALRR